MNKKTNKNKKNAQKHQNGGIKEKDNKNQKSEEKKQF